MSFLHKMRVLVSALAHKPFMPRPEKTDLDDEPNAPQGAAPGQDAAALEASQVQAEDTERVADLIARRQREKAD